MSNLDETELHCRLKCPEYEATRRLILHCCRCVCPQCDLPCTQCPDWSHHSRLTRNDQRKRAAAFQSRESSKRHCKMDKNDEVVLGQLVVAFLPASGQHPPDNTVVTISAKEGRNGSPPIALVMDAQHSRDCFGVLEPDGSAEMAGMILASQISAKGFITCSPRVSKLSPMSRYVSMTLFGYREHSELQSRLIMDANFTPHVENILCENNQLIDLVGSEIEALFDDGIDHSGMIQMEPHPDVTAELYRYQKQGLQWMLDRERPESLLVETNKLMRFWRRTYDRNRLKCYHNKCTKEYRKEPPMRSCGGILADDMGLGKTTQMISLIMSHRAPENACPTTLVVCPLSVMENWQTQLHQHTKEGAHPSVLVYHGPKRTKEPKELEKFDVVLTTFHTLSTDFCRGVNEKDPPQISKMGPVMKPNYWRVVLDEAHIIRESSTNIAKAVFFIEAQNRWCVTGTPIQNKVDDAYAQFKFLRVDPFCQRMFWNRLVLRPIKDQQDSGVKRLKNLLAVYTLRRLKSDRIDGEPILVLPPKTERVVTIKLDPHERKLYDLLESTGRNRYERLVSENQIQNMFLFIIEMITRMRQACTDTSLVPSYYWEKGFENSSHDNLNLMRRMLDKLLETLEKDEELDCCICMDHRVNCVTRCSHTFCTECLDRMMVEAGGRAVGCPLCRGTIAVDELVDISMQSDIEKREAEAAEAAKVHAAGKAVIQRSSKVKALLKFLLDDKNSKVKKKRRRKNVVFSQWTSMLNRIAQSFKEEGITYCRLDGSMNAEERRQALLQFRSDKKIRVMLISLHAGGCGISCTAASRVFLIDSWWNIAIEDQAIDRIHRIGQVNPVEVIRFVVQDSVEEAIVQIQRAKRAIIQQVVGTAKSKEQTEAEKRRDLDLIFKAHTIRSMEFQALAGESRSSPSS